MVGHLGAVPTTQGIETSVRRSLCPPRLGAIGLNQVLGKGERERGRVPTLELRTETASCKSGTGLSEQLRCAGSRTGHCPAPGQPVRCFPLSGLSHSPVSLPLPVLCNSFFLNFISLFLERRKGRERGRETSVCGCLSCTPYWGPGWQPRHVP